jgi:hypothetical protein
MEIEVKSAQVVKTGTSKKGPWELIRVVTPNGTEYTTFDKKAKHQGPGAIIDIGLPKIEKGKISFEEIVKVVKEGQVQSSFNPLDNGSYKADPAKLASEELRSRMHGAIQLIVADKLSIDDPEGKMVRAWIMGTNAPQPSQKPQEPAPKVKAEVSDTEKLLNRVCEIKGFSSTKTARAYIKKNFPNIDDERIDKDPNGVLAEIEPLL